MGQSRKGLELCAITLADDLLDSLVTSDPSPDFPKKETSAKRGWGKASAKLSRVVACLHWNLSFVVGESNALCGF